MSRPPTIPEERFAAIAAIVAAFQDNPNVTPPSDIAASRRRFGGSELKTDGRIFAMLSRDRLVVKLPRQRVDALIAAGDGELYDPRRDGRVMKEWVAVPATSDAEWLPLAEEALAFVGSRR